MQAAADQSWAVAAGLEAAPEPVFVRFGLHPKQNQEKTAEAGRPIFDDVEYVEIMVPGDKQNMIHRPVTARDRARFPRQYAAWKENKTVAQTGTPLEEWSGISRSQVEELRFFNVRTVEQLAGISDGNATNIGPIQALKAKALDFVDRAKGSAPTDKLRMELLERDKEIATLRSQVKELGDAVEGMRRERKTK
jgi:hypothetical protein